MYIIDLNFESIEELPVGMLFGAIGVYILWSPNARSRPTYLGEGVILTRLADHVKWLTSEVTGIVARLNEDSNQNRKAKIDAQITEVFLLGVSEELGCRPTKNKSPGNVMKLQKVFDRHGTLRLNIWGFHPFRHPDNRNARLKGRTELSLRFEKYDGEDIPVFQTLWNRRRR